MKHRIALLGVVTLASALAAAQALAADACLPNNRIVSTRVIDNNTILAISRTGASYTVRMRGTCIGLDRTAENVTFFPKTELGCLSEGDSIAYNRPGERVRVAVRPQTQATCVIDSVSEGPPPKSD